MKVSYISLTMMLFCSWSVYGICQNDLTLVISGFVVVIGSLLSRAGKMEEHYQAFDRMPLSALIIISFFIGLAWRQIVLIPDSANSPFPEYTAALQSGSIVAAILLWMKPFSKSNMYRLTFCSWLTVALSINVPFSGNMLIVFSSFCFTAVAIVIFNTMRRPVNKKNLFAYGRDYIVFSTILIMSTVVLFLGISRSIVALERAYLRTMSGFILPQKYSHFLRISSQLNLISPGISAFDRRPVLEISYPKIKNEYLRLQVFDFYKNGVWFEPKQGVKRPLAQVFNPKQTVGRMMMFTYFQNIIPAPGGIIAIRGNQHYFKDSDGLILTENPQNTRVLEFVQATDLEKVDLSDEDHERFTLVPESLSEKLHDIADSIVAADDDVKTKVRKLMAYFQTNFTYSLETDFPANDQGLIKMLEERRPAYCTYFASALTLLLRTQGIPARVAAGFLTTELVDRRNNTFLVRVNNAHAWAEVLMPEIDSLTGKTFYSWRTADATPASLDTQGILKPSFINLEQIFEKMWLGVLRWNARFENMDKNQLKHYLILVLLTAMIIFNREKIYSAFGRWLNRHHKNGQTRYQSPDSLRIFYRRYEQYLQEHYGISRKKSETDQELLERLQSLHHPIPYKTLVEFIKEFQAVRFGHKSSGHLPRLCQQFLGVKDKG